MQPTRPSADDAGDCILALSSNVIASAAPRPLLGRGRISGTRDHLHPMPSRTDSSSSICQRCLRREEARGSHESSRRVSRIVGVHTTDNSATTYAQKIGRTALSRHATILRAENIGTGSTKCNNRKPRHDGSFASALRRVEDDFVLGVIVFSHCNTFVGGQLDGS